MNIKTIDSVVMLFTIFIKHLVYNINHIITQINICHCLRNLLECCWKKRKITLTAL